MVPTIHCGQVVDSRRRFTSGRSIGVSSRRHWMPSWPTSRCHGGALPKVGRIWYICCPPSIFTHYICLYIFTFYFCRFVGSPRNTDLDVLNIHFLKGSKEKLCRNPRTWNHLTTAVFLFTVIHRSIYINRHAALWDDWTQSQPPETKHEHNLIVSIFV